MSTGDELVEIYQTAKPGQIVNSSSYALAALVELAGGEPWVLPIARDEHDDTLRRFQEAIAGSDLVLSIGGVSVGDYDVVKHVMAEVCGDLDFWKVRVKPGKPLAFGLAESGTPLIGLPGNPVSSYVTFFTFVWPAIRKMMGASRLFLPEIRAKLANDLRSTPTRLDMQRGRLQSTGGELVFEAHGHQGSGNPMSMVGMDGMAKIPVGVSSMEAGEGVDVVILPTSW